METNPHQKIKVWLPQLKNQSSKLDFLRNCKFLHFLWISQIYQFSVFKLFVSSTWKSHQNFLNNILNMEGHFISVWFLRRRYYRQTKHSVFLTLFQLNTNGAVACVAANVVPLSLLFMYCAKIDLISKQPLYIESNKIFSGVNLKVLHVEYQFFAIIHQI